MTEHKNLVNGIKSHSSNSLPSYSKAEPNSKHYGFDSEVRFTGQPEVITSSLLNMQDTTAEVLQAYKRQKIPNGLFLPCSEGSSDTLDFDEQKLLDNLFLKSESIDAVKEAVKNGDALFDTIDTWSIGGEDQNNNKIHGLRVTDCSNASRTMLMNLKTLNWDQPTLDALGIPSEILSKLTLRIELGWLKKNARSGVGNRS
ncbi:Glycerol kinase [Acorus calamus]|uniref:Glycerol kinase n=1 Tax=Acorus calamus TaxID=4465 RepID=A0AAV9C8Q0_ACOCL|nr:Glycerol kinase [Acorus calamus]